jgi:hypothetical protein
MAIINSNTPPSVMSQPDDSGAQQMVSPVAPAQDSTPAATQALQTQQQSAPQQPAVTTPAVPPSPNQRLHSFVSSVLGGITKGLSGAPFGRRLPERFIRECSRKGQGVRCHRRHTELPY